MLIHINLFTYLACVWSQPINPQIQALLIVQRACKHTVYKEKPGNLSAHGKLDLTSSNGMVHMLKMCLQRCTAVYHVLVACLVLHTSQSRMLLSPQGCDPEFTDLLDVTYEHSLTECTQVSCKTSNQVLWGVYVIPPPLDRTWKALCKTCVLYMCAELVSL